MNRTLRILLFAAAVFLPLLANLPILHPAASGLPVPQLVAEQSLRAQTVVDMHTGQVSGKTRDDYNYKAREAWQLREDSIAYNDCVTRAFNYLYADSLQAAQDLLERALKLRPDAPGNFVVRKTIGHIFMTRRQWKDATLIFGRILEDYPRNTEVREERALCFSELRQYAKALKDYDYLLALQPDDRHYRLAHALVLGQTGAKRDAIDELDELLETDEACADAYLARAGLYIDLGNKGRARRDLDLAVKHGVPKTDIMDLYEKLK